MLVTGQVTVTPSRQHIVYCIGVWQHLRSSAVFLYDQLLYEVGRVWSTLGRSTYFERQVGLVLKVSLYISRDIGQVPRFFLIKVTTLFW